MTALPRSVRRAPPFAEAIVAWREAIGPNRVIADTALYNADTSRFAGDIPVALRPGSVADVQAIVRIARRFGAPLYPVSTGRNWGYGTSVPPRSPAAIVDLSAMNRILGFDAELGVVTVEPGVTQGGLRAWLDARCLAFLVPVTGAGPDCSLLGNALERGFGVTPATDHWGAVLSLKAVLPNGELFESPARSFACAGAPGRGCGPQFEGLFSQSGFGIVVDASIALEARPERTGAMIFTLDTADDVEGAAAALSELLRTAGTGIGAVNLMSRERLGAMRLGADRLQLPDLGLPPGAWFGFGSVYGSREHFKATARLAQRRLRGRVRGLGIYSARDAALLRRLGALLDRFGRMGPGAAAARLQAALDIVDGIPSTVALPLAYAGSGRRRDGPLDPARDGCGLFWYAPLVPLKRGVVSQFLDFAQHTCARHDLEAPVTLTTLSPRCCAATLPLLFDRDDAAAERRAAACFERLYEDGLALGFGPYRMGAPFMPLLARHPDGSGPLARILRDALDPDRLIAPGRYDFD